MNLKYVLIISSVYKSNKNNIKIKAIGSQHTRISRESGCEQSTPVQVRSDIFISAIFSTPFWTSAAAAAAVLEDAAAAAFPPLLAAAAAFFAAAFFLLASDTIFNLINNMKPENPKTAQSKNLYETNVDISKDHETWSDARGR